jgi:hypothetical protein
MVILQPCGLNVVTANQVTAPALQYVAADPAWESITSSKYLVAVRAPGMKSVQMWTHGKLATRLALHSSD